MGVEHSLQAGQLEVLLAQSGVMCGRPCLRTGVCDAQAQEQHAEAVPGAHQGGPGVLEGAHERTRRLLRFMYTEGDDDVVETVGVHDLVVVKRVNTVLLVAKDRVEDVKAVFAEEGLG